MQHSAQTTAKIGGVDIYIISWSGQHDNATAIATELGASFENVTIVYSDPDPAFGIAADCAVMVRPNHLFWADKFRACITSCKSDILLVGNPPRIEGIQK